MTIDERLEALTMNVELMALEQKDLHQSLRDFQRLMRQSLQTLTELHSDGERETFELRRNMRDLQRVVASHEDRIHTLETK